MSQKTAVRGIRAVMGEQMADVIPIFGIFISNGDRTMAKAYAHSQISAERYITDHKRFGTLRSRSDFFIYEIYLQRIHSPFRFEARSRREAK